MFPGDGCLYYCIDTHFEVIVSDEISNLKETLFLVSY